MAWEPTGREAQPASGVSWRSLSSGMRTFVAIDGVLLLGLLVLLVVTLARAGGRVTVSQRAPERASSIAASQIVAAA